MEADLKEVKEQGKTIYKRVKVPTEKRTIPFLVILGAVLVAIGVFILLKSKSDIGLIAMSIFCFIMGAFIMFGLSFIVYRQVKLSNETNTYPEEALILSDDEVEIVTYKSETYKYNQIKSVRGIRFVGNGFGHYKIYYFGNLIIKLKDGKKILLKGIDNVLDVAKVLKQKIK